MTEQELKKLTKDLALKTITFSGRVPRNQANDIMTRQLVRCATSVGANYRAACRAKSRADMIAKLAIVEEEADETIY